MAGIKHFKHFFEPYPLDSPSLGIHGVGIRERMGAGMINRPHGTPDYLLMAFHQPCVVCDRDGERLRPARSFIAWPPGTPHHYGNPRLGWSHTWLHCDGKSLRRWLGEAGVPCNTVVPLSGRPVFDECLEMLYRELTGPFPPDETIASNLIEIALRAIGRAIRPDGPEPAPPWLLELRDYLDRHFTEKLCLKELARRSHYSPSHLCDRFKRHYRLSIGNYIIRLRLQRAVYLLGDHGRSIGEIAALAGYDDIYHFSKLFKSRYGMSPGAMRRSIRDRSRNRAAELG